MLLLEAGEVTQAVAALPATNKTVALEFRAARAFCLAALFTSRARSTTDKMIDMPYLLKSEPDAYSFSDLQRDGETIWDGVTNPVAVKNLREMKAGEKLVIYHTGTERQAVGTAAVVSVDASDTKTPRVKIKAGRPIKEPRTLAQMKELKLFADSPLATQGRLSVVPLTNEQYEWITKS